MTRGLVYSISAMGEVNGETIKVSRGVFPLELSNFPTRCRISSSRMFFWHYVSSDYLRSRASFLNDESQSGMHPCL
jgi:hypothetical protein